MLTRTSAALTALLSLAGLGAVAAPAQAQGYFGVESTAQTLGYPGTYTDNSVQINGTAADAFSDPAGAYLTSTGYGTAYADVAAASETRIGQLHASSSAHTESVTAKTFNGAAPYGYGYAHFYDRFTVKSDTLPAGAPVTIVFGNVVDKLAWTHTGVYDGYIEMILQIAAATARSRWSAHYLYGITETETPTVRIQTTVGSRFSVDGKLRTQAKAFYWDGTVGFGGDIRADATARLVIREITAGATLQSESGTVYPIEPVN